MEWTQVMGIACWCFVIGLLVGARAIKVERDTDPEIRRGQILVEHFDWCKKHIDNNRLFAGCGTIAMAVVKWRGRTYEMSITEKEEEHERA